MSSVCTLVGLSGYVAAIVCNRPHVERPSSSLSNGQSCRCLTGSSVVPLFTDEFCAYKNSLGITIIKCIENNEQIHHASKELTGFSDPLSPILLRCILAHVLKSVHDRQLAGCCGSLFCRKSMPGIFSTSLLGSI